MRFAYFMLVWFLPLACRNATIPPGLELLPRNNRLRERSSTRVSTSELTTYTVKDLVDVNGLSGFPRNTTPEYGWRVREWREQASPGELASLVEFLSEQREMFAYSGRHAPEVEALNTLIGDLSSWGLDGSTHRSLISYLYQHKPGTRDYHSGHWLYVYYFNVDSMTITAITNAFR